MKIQIRKNIFETNSSSVHAITVTSNKKKYDTDYLSIHFCTGKFGWEHRTYYDVYDKASYLWTAIVHRFVKEYVSGGYKKDSNGIERYVSGYIILDKENPEYIKRREAIRTALVHAGMKDDGWDIRFEEDFNTDYDGPSEGGYIDHTPGFDFIDSLVFNEDRLIRFLFDDKSTITTWNDNEWYYDGEDGDYVSAPDYEKDPDGYQKYWENKDWKYFGINPDDKDIEWKYLKDN